MPNHKVHISKAAELPEIRVRSLKPNTGKQLAAIARVLKTKNIPDTILQMIEQFEGDQFTIANLRKRNDQLHKHCEQLADNQTAARKILHSFILHTGKVSNQATAIFKRMDGKKKAAPKKGGKK